MKTWTSLLLCGLCAVAVLLGSTAAAEEPIKVMIIGGQNNHDWKKSTPFMAKLLNEADHIEATVYNTPERGAPAEAWDAWQPKFADYDCVVLDYNGQMWPERVQKDYLDYGRGGGGVQGIHAANNSVGGGKE